MTKNNFLKAGMYDKADIAHEKVSILIKNRKGDRSHPTVVLRSLMAVPDKYMTGTEIVLKTKLGQPNVSKTLRTLMGYGYVDMRKNGKEHLFRINAEEISRVNSIVKEFA
jgi:DNA-binding transcriptional ArsR family regulator